ncbi:MULTISPECIES: hypothetical protein [unclassified Chelatococcus]|uniref:hypothetical protein n=1 Tax=unclassified Chelatococcus TaxID=2638111 RepID=UPI001BCD1C4C|nr:MULTISPECIES: hypothetical protein [unclassified Chelatococcus]MBS7697848.1 hypothetical protein [Chelatococcus sp. YT9]MBX3559797.1 hypothetical protein [Chelatococcus sp.]
MAFSIGEKVRIVDGCRGVIYEVRKVDEFKGYKLRHYASGLKMRGWWGEHELMRDGAYPRPERKFKLGDWVETRDGEVGIVFHDDGDEEASFPYYVGYVEDGSTEWCSANEIVPHLPS